MAWRSKEKERSKLALTSTPGCDRSACSQASSGRSGHADRRSDPHAHHQKHEQGGRNHQGEHRWQGLLAEDQLLIAVRPTVPGCPFAYCRREFGCLGGVCNVGTVRAERFDDITSAGPALRASGHRQRPYHAHPLDSAGWGTRLRPRRTGRRAGRAAPGGVEGAPLGPGSAVRREWWTRRIPATTRALRSTQASLSAVVRVGRHWAGAVRRTAPDVDGDRQAPWVAGGLDQQAAEPPRVLVVEPVRTRMRSCSSMSAMVSRSWVSPALPLMTKG